MADPDQSPEGRINSQDNRPVEDAAEEFIRLFKKQIFETMVREVPDAVLQPGQDEALGRCIERIVDARLTADKVPIGRQLRKKLIESILEDIQRAGRDRFPGG